MAPPKVLVLGHSFVRRLKFDLRHQSDLRMSPNFKLEGTARIYARHRRSNSTKIAATRSR